MLAHRLFALSGQLVALLIIYVASRLSWRPKNYKFLLLIAFVLTPLGAIPQIAGMVSIHFNPLLSLAMVFLFGLGHACMICYLAFVLDDLAGPLMGLALALATLFSCAVFAFVMSIPPLFQAMSLAILPGACCVVMLIKNNSSKDSHVDERSTRKILLTRAGKQGLSSYTWLCVLILFFSFAFSIAQVLGWNMTGTGVVSDKFVISILIAGLGLLAYGLFARQYIQAELVLWFLLPIGGLGFLLLMLGYQRLDLLSWVLITGGFTAFDMLSLYSVSSFMKYHDLPIIRYFSLSRFFNALGIALGWSLGLAIAPVSRESLQLLVVVLVTVMLILFSVFIWQTRRMLDEALNTETGLDVQHVLPQVLADQFSPKQRRPWRESCSAVSKDYDLSPREQEVFYLLSNGRTAKYISEKLFISHSTVKSHMYRIYRKLNIESQQELIDLVEEYRSKIPHTTR